MWLIYIAVVWIVGIFVLQFLSGLLEWDGENNIFMIVLWPMFAALGLVVVPLLLVEELGSWIRRKYIEK